MAHTAPPTSPPVAEEIRELQELNAKYALMRQQLGGVLVGLEDVIEQTFVAMLCRGHCILQGMPGLAKTMLVSTLASILHLTFRRIQFTPDLMPADITGTDVLEEDRTSGKRVFRFVKGPLFGNIILADEINRTPPKTQSALLEAMQERQLTIGGETYPLPEPFFVLATQNPIEQEGTYALPEAQLDRFLFKVQLEYPTFEQEVEVCRRVTTDYKFESKTVFTGDDLLRWQKLIRLVPAADHVYAYAVHLSQMTRPSEGKLPKDLESMVQWGAGPRASIYLLWAAKARAVLHGRFHATTEDVRAIALPVLRHRIIPTFNAEAAGITTDQIVTRLLEELGRQDGRAPRKDPLSAVTARRSSP